MTLIGNHNYILYGVGARIVQRYPRIVFDLRVLKQASYTLILDLKIQNWWFHISISCQNLYFRVSELSL